MPALKPRKTIWIIGASSGIGRALAKSWADKGASLVLSARREDRLNELNHELGGGHFVLPLDVSQVDTIDRAIGIIKDQQTKLDHIVNLSAIYSPGKLLDMDLERIEKIIDVNLTGMFRFVYRVIPMLEAQGGGQVALCGSVAGYMGLPNAQPYSATKAGIINLAESMRLDLKGKKIDVRIINPGFVKTDMTDQNNFEMPAIITAEIAASKIIKGLEGQSFEIHFPKHFTYFLKFISKLPYPVSNFLLKRIG